MAKWPPALVEPPSGGWRIIDKNSIALDLRVYMLDSHCTWWVHVHLGHLAHIAPSKPMTSIAQHSPAGHESWCVPELSPPLNPFYQKYFESNPVWWEAAINIHIRTTVWMYHLNINKIFWENAQLKLIAMGILLLLVVVLLGFWFRLVLHWSCWYYVGCVGISLVVIPSLNVDGK